MSSNIEKSFSLAQERYAGLGVDVDRALKTLAADSDFTPLLAGRRRGRL